VADCLEATASIVIGLVRDSPEEASFPL
jgi:hypothetical protein